MNFIAQESAQKLRGGFYTERAIADFLAEWVLESRPRALLEPSCGDGAFLEAAARCRKGHGLPQIVACEINPEEAAKARERLSPKLGAKLRVVTTDFLEWFFASAQERVTFDAVLGNPPFIRYQYLPDRKQMLARRLITGLDLPFTKHTNAWVPFLVASVALLAPGGRLGMIIPAELFHIPHAESARRFLAAQCARTLILDSEELWFADALQGVVLVLAEKRSRPGDRGTVAVQSVRKDQLVNASSFFETAQFGVPPEGKWMRSFLSRPERIRLEQAEADGRFSRFARVAKVDVGIVTGANKFFLVPDDVVAQHGLAAWARPMIGRSEHMPGVIYGQADQARNAAAGVPTNFLWFGDADRGRYSTQVQNYFRLGEAEALHTRYKCRVREPWFRVPSVYASPVCMLKRAHHFPRLVLNEAKVFTTDTVYRIKPTGSPAALVYSFVNSLTALCAELEGRHYGGGVLELVPSEIERLLLPVVDTNDAQLRALDAHFRRGAPADEILRIQDREVLSTAGFTAHDLDLVHSAWNRLRQRRQRAGKA